MLSTPKKLTIVLSLKLFLLSACISPFGTEQSGDMSVENQAEPLMMIFQTYTEDLVINDFSSQKLALESAPSPKKGVQAKTIPALVRGNVQVIPIIEENSLNGIYFDFDGFNFKVFVPGREVGNYIAKRQVLSPDLTGQDYVIDFGLEPLEIPVAQLPIGQSKICKKDSNEYYDLERKERMAAVYALTLYFKDATDGSLVASFVSLNFLPSFDSKKRKQACKSIELLYSI